LKKENNLGFEGLYYFAIKPLIKELLHIPFVLLRIVRAKSLEPFFVSLREPRYILNPSSRCSICGRKVKQKWILIIACVLYQDMDENLRLCLGFPSTKPFDRKYIGCKYCDPSLTGKSIYGDIITEEHGRKLESWKKWRTDKKLILP